MSSDFLGHVADLQKMIAKKRNTLHVESHSKTEITEKRAPTDDSIRILGEMERAAENRLVCVMSCQATAFSFTTHVFRDPANPFEQRMRIRFSLGETPYDIDVEVDPSKAQNTTSFLVVIRDAVAKEIANTIMRGSYQELVKFHRF